MTPKKRNRDITYKLTPEELKYFSWVSMSPELRRQNRNNRVKAYLLSAPSIGNFWEALLTYIGNRDPENPHLNTGEAPNASRAINPKLVVQVALTAGKIVDKAKRYITLTKESTKMLNYPRIGQRYSKSLDIMSDFNPISDLLHLRLPDFTHSSLGLGNKYRAIGGRKALKSVIENGVVAPKGLFSREGKVFWNDGYLNRTYSGRGIFALSYDKTGKAPFYPGGKPNNRYVYSLHENPIDFYDEALGLHARIPFTSTYVEIPKTLAGIDRALKLDKINRYIEKPVHKLYNWGLKPYLGYLGFKYFNSKEEEINKKEELEKLKKQQYLDDYYSYYYKNGGLIRKMQTAAGGPIHWLRKRLYNNIEPFGYNEAGSRLINAVVLNKNEHNNFKGDYSDTERAPALYLTIDNIWGEYLHIPEKERRYSNGKYKIKNNGNGTFSLPFESMEDIMQSVNSNNPLLWGQRGKLGNSVVGEYDVHRGYDKNGDYLKYIDHWRINPYDVKEDKEYGLDNNSLLKWYFKGKDDASFGLGTPVEIQGKYYLDDIYNIKGKDRGGHYLPEVVVTGKKKRNEEVK